MSAAAAGRVFASAGILLLALAAWLLWPADAGASAVAVDGAVDGAVDVARAADVSTSAATVPLARTVPAARAGAEPVGLRVRVRPASSLDSPGLLGLLRRPAFAPDVRFDDELWRVFVDGQLGDLAAQRERVFDRLARLGYELVAERAWRHTHVVEFPAEIVADACFAVALTARGVGFVGVAGCCERDLRLFGAGELDAAGRADEVWAWSDSAFPGPHRVRPGSRLPAALAYALQVTGEPTTVRYFDPVDVPAGGVARLSLAPRARTCRLAIDSADRPGTLVHLGPTGDIGATCHASDVVVLGSFDAGVPFVLRQEGCPFGGFACRSPAGLRAVRAVDPP